MVPSHLLSSADGFFIHFILEAFVASQSIVGATVQMKNRKSGLLMNIVMLKRN
jgi:hypothetical protein